MQWRADSGSSHHRGDVAGLDCHPEPVKEAGVSGELLLHLEGDLLDVPLDGGEADDGVQPDIFDNLPADWSGPGVRAGRRPIQFLL
jgi:hypothetical protein